MATISLLLLLLITLTAAAPPPPTCSDQVLALSPCLPYVSDPPNNITDSPSSTCCDVVSAAFLADEADCLCYLIRRPLILGFPLNSTKLFSLSSICSLNSSANHGITSLDFICSGTEALPPLQSTTGSGLSTPDSSGSVNSPPPSVTLSQPNPSEISAPPEPSDDSSFEPRTPAAANISSASGWHYRNRYWSPCRTTNTILIVSIFCSL